MKNPTPRANHLLIVFAFIVLAAAFPGCSSSSGQSDLAQSAAEPDSKQDNHETPSNAEKPAGEANDSSASLQRPRAPREVTLGEGTQLVVRTASRISTKTNQPGDLFYATLQQPLVDGDWVIARKGAEIEGIVSECNPGGRVKGVARLAVQLRKLTLADGRTLDIRTSVIRRQARTTKKKDAQKIGIGAGLGAAIGAIAGGGKGAAIGAAVGGGAGSGVVMATHGDPATIGSESRLTFKLTDPVRIVEEP